MHQKSWYSRFFFNPVRGQHKIHHQTYLWNLTGRYGPPPTTKAKKARHSYLHCLLDAVKDPNLIHEILLSWILNNDVVIKTSRNKEEPTMPLRASMAAEDSCFQVQLVSIFCPSARDSTSQNSQTVQWRQSSLHRRLLVEMLVAQYLSSQSIAGYSASPKILGVN